MLVSDFHKFSFFTPKNAKINLKSFENNFFQQKKKNIYILELRMKNTQTKFQTNTYIFV